MPLTKREAKQLRDLHRKAMKAAEEHYGHNEFSHAREAAVQKSDAAFLRAVNTMCADGKPVTIVSPLMAADLLPKRRPK